MTENKNIICQICGNEKGLSDVVPAESVRGPILELIKRDNPNWDQAGFICQTDLNKFRAQYVENVLDIERGEVTSLESQLSTSIDTSAVMTKNVNDEFDRSITFGEKMADRIADFGGSWKFIGIFGAIIFIWMILNTVLIFLIPVKAFDPYPFIFLNLILSCLAALQAPVIMMSQNRQETKDRFQAEHDYRTNLIAELEIKSLHDKVDYLLMHQWQRLLEIQKIQMELMEQIASGRSDEKVDKASPNDPGQQPA
ncbi:MAG: DUF1003 domain-containing protein [bacterium]|nr:DUF1003 domain-containing protein [bacterium]